MENVINGTFEFPVEEWEHISPAAINFVRALLRVDPMLRMTADEALEHEWLVQMVKVPATELPVLSVTNELSFSQSVSRRTSGDHFGMSLSAIVVINENTQFWHTVPQPSPRRRLIESANSLRVVSPMSARRAVATTDSESGSPTSWSNSFTTSGIFERRRRKTNAAFLTSSDERARLTSPTTPSSSTTYTSPVTRQHSNGTPEHHHHHQQHQQQQLSQKFSPPAFVPNASMPSLPKPSLPILQTATRSVSTGSYAPIISSIAAPNNNHSISNNNINSLNRSTFSLTSSSNSIATVSSETDSSPSGSLQTRSATTTAMSGSSMPTSSSIAINRQSAGLDVIHDTTAHSPLANSSFKVILGFFCRLIL
jgi:serine/threonine protein kinase